MIYFFQARIHFFEDPVVVFILLLTAGVRFINLAFFVGFWLLFNGISTISTSIDLKKYQKKGWVWILLSGVLTTILAFMVLVNPLYAVSFLSVFIGLSLIFSGIAQIMISLELRSLGKDIAQI